MPNTPSDVAHEANLHATAAELLPEAEAQLIAEAGDGKEEAMLLASTETGAAQAASEVVAPMAAESIPSPVRRTIWVMATEGDRRDTAGGRHGNDEGGAGHHSLHVRLPQLARSATKGRADPPDEQCDAEEVRCGRAYQAYALASCSEMRPAAAAIAVDALQPTAKAGRPELGIVTVACMREASRKHADTQIDDEDDDDWDGLGEFDADSTGREDADAVDRIFAAAGIGPNADPLDVIDALQRPPAIDASVWSPVLEKRFGWAVAETDEDVERNGG